jgi:hypothetical protein
MTISVTAFFGSLVIVALCLRLWAERFLDLRELGLGITAGIVSQMRLGARRIWEGQEPGGRHNAWLAQAGRPY